MSGGRREVDGAKGKGRGDRFAAGKTGEGKGMSKEIARQHSLRSHFVCWAIWFSFSWMCCSSVL